MLLATTCVWPSTAWLAIVLSRVGCDVAALSPAAHPVRAVGAVARHESYSAFRPEASLRRAIERIGPDCIVACDDRVVGHLAALHAAHPELRPIIERSFGDAHAFRIAGSRMALLDLAADAGVPTPDSARIESENDLRAWQARMCLPWVLKVDGSWGGVGVRIVRSFSEATEALGELQSAFSARVAITRLLMRGDPFWLKPWLQRRRGEVSIQAFVDGPPATCTVACWEGEVLGGIALEVMNAVSDGGPSAVVRVLDNPQMLDAASRVVRTLGLSGFVGFDFMIDRATGAALMIEMNPRATPTSHLQLGEGRDLVEALRSRLADTPSRAWPPVTTGDTIALFPDAWLSDPASETLRTSYHDVPWSEPELMRELLRPQHRGSDLLAKWSVAALRAVAPRSGAPSPQPPVQRPAAE